MKVRCIHRFPPFPQVITIGKEYEVVKETNEFYRIIDNIDVPRDICKKYFEVIG